LEKGLSFRLVLHFNRAVLLVGAGQKISGPESPAVANCTDSMLAIMFSTKAVAVCWEGILAVVDSTTEVADGNAVTNSRLYLP
jgi:hypothetical protein